MVGVEAERACVTLSAGDGYGIAAGGELGLTAGVTIVLENGFTIDSDGELVMALDPALPTP